MVCDHTYPYIHTPDSAKAEGSSIVDEPGRAEPLCIKGANREVSEGEHGV